MAPPSTSLRSSTQTFQPPRASSAAPVSELTPEPTKTASKPATARKIPVPRAPRPVPLCGHGRPAPGGESRGEPVVAALARPGDVAVGPDQNGGGRGHRAEGRQLPRAVAAGLDARDPPSPRRGVEAAEPA